MYIINYSAFSTQNVLWIINWRTLMHMRQADAACALTRWQHLSA